MCAVAGAGAFERGRHLAAVAGVEVCERVEDPAATVEVAGQQRTDVPRQERIDTHRGFTTEMTRKNFVGERQVLLPRPFVRPPAAHGRGPP